MIKKEYHFFGLEVIDMMLELKINKIMLDKLQKVCYNVGIKYE